MIVIWVSRIGDHLAPAAISHHRDLRGFVHRICVSAQLDHWRPLAVGDLADHRPDVSALYLLYDHRSEDDGALEARPMRRRIPDRCGGDGLAPGPECLCAVLCALPGWAGR